MSEETVNQTSEQAETGDQESKKRTFVEEVEVTGQNLVERIKGLLQESNTRRVVIKSHEGNELMTIPLTVGAVAGGILALSAPMLAALGALAALVTRVKLEVIREEDDDSEAEA